MNITELLTKHYGDNMTWEDYNDLFFDWFCREESLANRSKRLIPKVKMVAKSPKINPNKCRVIFKNNCPLYGDYKLYDDFRIVDIETDNILYTVVPRNPYGKAEVWGYENGFSKALIEGEWKEVKEWFLK